MVRKKPAKTPAVIKQSEGEALELAESIIDTLREPILILGPDLRIIKAGRSFYETFKVTPAETLGQFIFDLGNRQWDIPRLRDLLESILPQKSVFNDYEVKHDFPIIGSRTMLLNAREIKQDVGRPLFILLAIEDITKRKRAEETLANLYLKNELILNSAAEGILGLDLQGNHTFINPAAAKILGYESEELLGRPSHSCWHHSRPEGSLYPQEDCPICKTYLNGGDHRESNAMFWRKDGTGFPSEYVSTPILKNGQVTGVVVTFSDVSERKQAEEKLLKSHESLEKTLNNAINTMVKIVETRDPYTAGHQHRVAELATAIAMEMMFEETQIGQLRTAAVLHDIGKIYIPSDILSKPGKLSDLEFGLIKTHSQAGFDIVKGMDFPGAVAETILQHHERLDGSGYPNGLKADDTLMKAKILAVADVVEAMTSHRPYRPTLGINKALEEISKNRGRLYDPDVVDACMDLFNSGRFEFKIS